MQCMCGQIWCLQVFGKFDSLKRRFWLDFEWGKIGLGTLLTAVPSVSPLYLMRLFSVSPVLIPSCLSSCIPELHDDPETVSGCVWGLRVMVVMVSVDLILSWIHMRSCYLKWGKYEVLPPFFGWGSARMEKVRRGVYTVAALRESI